MKKRKTTTSNDKRDREKWKEENLHISQLLTRHKNNEFPPATLTPSIRQLYMAIPCAVKKALNILSLLLSLSVVMLLMFFIAHSMENDEKLHESIGKLFVNGACALLTLRQFQRVTCECDIDLFAFTR